MAHDRGRGAGRARQRSWTPRHKERGAERKHAQELHGQSSGIRAKELSRHGREHAGRYAGEGAGAVQGAERARSRPWEGEGKELGLENLGEQAAGAMEEEDVRMVATSRAPGS
jgi:hypothetical protein